MAAEQQLFAKVIENQRLGLRYQVAYSLSLVLLGLIAISVAFRYL